jgi:RND family efflux transporter MFP subunit
MQSDFHLPEPADTRRLKIAGLVALLLAGGVVAAGALGRLSERHAAQGWSDTVAVPTVRLVAVAPVAPTQALTLPGTLQAWNTARIFPQVNGYVKAWYKDIGQPVGAGTLLGLIQTPEVDQQIVQARADLARAHADQMLAARTAQRWNDLLSSASVSKQEADEKNGSLEDRKAAVLAAQANLDRLIAMKDFASLRAPFAGTVTMRSAEIGDFVGPNADSHQPLFAIADTHAIRVYVSVPQAYAAGIRPGLTVTMTVPEFPGRTFPARLVGDAGAVSPQSGAFQIELVADNPDRALRSGGYAQVSLDLPRSGDTIVIPSSALLLRGGGTQVATVGTGNRITLHTVTIGRDLGPTVEVTAGIARGSRIVDSPPDSLADGEVVRVTGGDHG